MRVAWLLGPVVAACTFTGRPGDPVEGGGDTPADAARGAGDGTPAPGTLDLPAAADGWLREQFPTEAHGGDADLRTGSGSTTGRANRLVIQFDLAAVAPACQVTDARLYLYYFAEDFAGISPVLEVHRITAPWVEGTATWISSGSTAWSAAGGDFDARVEAQVVAPAGGFGWLAWDVRGLVAAWLAGTPNFGAEIVEPNDSPGNMGRKLFRSMQSGDASQRPHLMIACS